MKKQFLLILLSIHLVADVKSQQLILNGGMEDWITRTSGSANYEDPQDWFSLNQLKQFGFPATTTKTSEAHSGISAVLLSSKKGMFGLIPGLLTLRPMLNEMGDPDLSLNMAPIKERPLSIQFWYKSQPETDDQNSMYLVLTKWNSTTATRDTIGTASWSTDSVINNYAKAIVNIDYSSEMKPDSIFLMFSSSYDGFNPIVGSKLFLDDIQLNYSTGIATVKSGPQFVVYPNPFRDEFTIKGLSGNYRLRVLDQFGKLIHEQDSQSDNGNINLGLLSDGVYFLQIESLGGGEIQNVMLHKNSNQF